MRDYEPFRRKLAAAIMARRQTLGLSQEEVARRSKLHRTYISDVERGERNISVDSLRRLSVALGFPMWSLIKDAEDDLGTQLGEDLGDVVDVRVPAVVGAVE